MFRKIVLFSFLVSQIIFAKITVSNGKIDDGNGNTIALKTYKKIVVADPAVVETLYMIGSEKNIVAISTSAKTRIYPEDKTSKLESVGNVAKLNLEKIISYSPDLVILNPMATNIVPNLKNLKIPVIVNNAINVDEILENIIIYGKITDNEDSSLKLYNELSQKLKNLKSELAQNQLKLKGCILYSTSPMMAFNKNSLPGEILNLLGVENIADNLVGNKPILSSEYILQTNPDFLAGAMNISVDEITKNNSIIMKTNAGKKGNIFIVDSQKILRSSPRIIQSIEELYQDLKKIK